MRHALAVVAALAGPAAASEIKRDETVILYRTTAHREGEAWVVPLHGWIGEPEPDSVWRSALVRGLLTAIGREPSGDEAAVFRARAGWFLADNERGKSLSVEVGQTAVRVGPSGKDGRVTGELRLPARAVTGDRLVLTTVARDGRQFRGEVALVAGPGLAVVSDIDDTIKVSHVLDRRALMRNTFLRPFVAVDGMTALYRRLTGRGAVFFYVSGSPWQLYEPLREWLGRAGFPPGELALREFRVKDDRRWNLLEPADRHKLSAIRALLRRFPERRFVLIGDAAERDPEIYGTIARESPARIARVLIRRLPGDRMTAERWRSALGPVGTKAIAFESSSQLDDGAIALDR